MHQWLGLSPEMGHHQQNRPGPQAVAIRPFTDRDTAQVRELVIAVNRLLSPPDLRDAFEAYIERALSEEINRTSDYYGERMADFGLHFGEIRWSAHSVWNARQRQRWNCAACMSPPRRGDRASRDRCSNLPHTSDTVSSVAQAVIDAAPLPETALPHPRLRSPAIAAARPHKGRDRPSRNTRGLRRRRSVERTPRH